MPYQTVGNLNIRYKNHKQIKKYYRELDLTRAIATTRYQIKDVEITEETFASFTDQLIIKHIKSSKRVVLIVNYFFKHQWTLQNEVLVERKNYV